MFTITVTTDTGKFTKSYGEKVLLSKALLELGVFLDMPCGGHGTCRKCGVNANGKNVLACQTYADGDTAIYCGVSSGKLQTVMASDVSAGLAPVAAGGYGMAVDIGTTTLCAAFYNLASGEKIDEITLWNEQYRHGADVISRIEYASKNGLDDLGCVNRQITALKANFGKPVSSSVICGNTTMLSLYKGIDPTPMGFAPFTPKELFGKHYGTEYLPHCISAFIGADTVCAIVASGMIDRDETALLIDIGTNGEMALYKDGRLTCASVSAGPAFEGAAISMGMLGISGAVNTVALGNGGVIFTTIDDYPEKGICGSGLIDAVACFLQLGAFDETGAITSGGCLRLGYVEITQQDIRNVQLAKSAIRAGIETLLRYSGTASVDRFYIAGSFGTFINLRNAAKIGLIPHSFIGKATVMGNAAIAGATQILLDKAKIDTCERIFAIAEATDLATNPDFMDLYIENMSFKLDRL